MVRAKIAAYLIPSGHQPTIEQKQEFTYWLEGKEELILFKDGYGYGK